MRSGDLPNGLEPGGSSALQEVVDMSDEENEPGGDEVASEDTTVEGTSIFDAFEPPPEVDPNRFGPVPIIGEDSAASTIEAESTTEIAGDGLTIDEIDRPQVGQGANSRASTRTGPTVVAHLKFRTR